MQTQGTNKLWAGKLATVLVGPPLHAVQVSVLVLVTLGSTSRSPGPGGHWYTSAWNQGIKALPSSPSCSKGQAQPLSSYKYSA